MHQARPRRLSGLSAIVAPVLGLWVVTGAAFGQPNVSPKSLSFACPGALTQTVSVTSTPSGQSWAAASDGGIPGLSITPRSGSTPGSFSVAIDCSAGLSPSPIPYESQITVQVGAAFLVILVDLTVNSCISVSPPSLALSWTEGSPAPPTQSLKVTSGCGVQTLTAVASSTPPGWLSVSPTSGTTPADLSIYINPTGLSPGASYTGSITVTSSGSSQTIRISLTVTNAPTLTVSPASLLFSYETSSAGKSAEPADLRDGQRRKSIFHCGTLGKLDNRQ